MAIDITSVNPFSPAFLRLAPSILDAARPQIEPVGYAQRYGFVGPVNELQQNNETSPTNLRTVVAPQRETVETEPSANNDLFADRFGTGSRVTMSPQLDLFGEQSGVAGMSNSDGANGLRGSSGLNEYASVQFGSTRPEIARSLSVTA